MNHWKKRVSTAVLASMLASIPSFASAYDYRSFNGLQFTDPAMIPAESKAADELKSTSELKPKLIDPKTILGALPAKESHPSLWFKSDALASYQARKNIKGSYYEKLWTKIKEDVNLYIQYNYSDPNLHENDRSRGAKLLAFYYMMIKDDKSYTQADIDKVKSQAITATVNMYTGTVEKRTKDDGDIYWATYLQDYASAYDWLQPFLSEAQNKEARARLKKEANFIADWLMIPQPPRPHNHRSKPALGLGTVALTLANEPEAQYWMNLAIERTQNTFDYQFSSDGISREGAHYAVFTFVNLIPFLYQYKNVVGDAAPANIGPSKLIAQSQPMFDYAIWGRMGNGWLPSTEDSYVKPYPTHMVANLYKNVDAPQFGAGLKLGEVYQWNYDNTQVYLADYTGATSQYQIAIDEYLTYDSSIAAKRPTASRTVFLNGGMNPKTKKPFGGIAILGNQWNSKFEQGGDKTLWLSFNGHPESDNHQHQDQLHFNIYGKNALLANDTGYGQYSAFASFLKTSQGHNVITMNGKGVKNETDPMYTVRTNYEIPSSNVDFVEKEGDYYSDQGEVIGTHNRAISFPGKEYFVVADRVSAKNGKADFDMYLHSLGALQLNGNHAQWSVTKEKTPELIAKPDPSQAAVVPYYDLGESKLETYIFPQTSKFTSKDSVTSLFKEDIKETYLTAEQKADKAQYLTLLVPQGLNESAPDVQDLSTSSMSAARLSKGGSTDTFVLQAASGTSVTAGRLTTDASYGWLRESGTAVSDLMIREGKLAQVNGSKLISSDVPVTLVQHQDNTGWSGSVSGVNQAAKVSFTLPVGATVKSVTVGGAKVDAKADGRVLTLAFAQSSSYSIQFDAPLNSASLPTAKATADKPSEFGERGKGVRTVKFSSTGSTGSGLTYAWNFGDGTTSDQASPTKEFKAFGTYLVNLKVTDSAGNTDTVTIPVENKDPNKLPDVKLVSDVTSGRPGTKISFDASASKDPDVALGDKIVKYEWNFGDGTPVQSGAELSKIEHTFNKVGAITVTLTATDILGGTTVVTLPVSIGSPFGYIDVKKVNPDDEEIYALFEAEDYTYNSSEKNDQITLVTSDKASGKKYVKFGKNLPDVTSKDIMDPAYKDTMPADKVRDDMEYVQYELKVTDPGSFQAHIYSTGESASNGSVFVQWDDSDLRRITLKDLDWKRAYDNYQFALDEGVHVLKIWSRKGGADIDRILIMTDGTTHTKVQSSIIPKITQTYPVTLFSDLAGHWAKDAIEDFGLKKLVNAAEGKKFKPDAEMTRKDFLELLTAVTKIKAEQIEASLTEPNRAITRQEAAAFTIRAHKQLGKSIEVTDAEAATLLAAFDDSSSIGATAKLDIAAAVKAKLLNGVSDKKLAPAASVTRAQAVTLIKRLEETSKAK